MLLTIAIPAHNKASYLQKAIKSIIKDDEFGKNVNIVISDNSNNPEIKNLYERYYINNKKISYFSSKKYNCLDSNVNRSVQLANGKYVWVFGDDDILISGMLKKILKFLKTKNPNLLICNSKSFANRKIIESSRMPHIKNSFYDKNENDKFLIDMAGYLTYVGAIIVKRNLWLANYNKNKIGSFFAHIDCVASIKNNREVHYFRLPAIKMRLGSQTWLNKSFQIWYLFYPDIIWGLKNYSYEAKQKVIQRLPLNSIKLMLAAKAYGRINFQIFKKYVLKSQEVIAIKKFIILFIAILPTKFFSLIYVQYIKNFKNKHTISFSPKLALAQINRILK